MRAESGRISGGQTISDAVALSGTIDGDVVVEGGASLHVERGGTVTGGVTVRERGRLEIDGTVHGAVVNEGGIIKHRGEIRGLLYGSGSTSIDAGASVNGRRV